MTTTSPLRCSHSNMVLHPATGKVVLLNPGNYPGVSNFLNVTSTWNGTDWTNNATTNSFDPLGPTPGRTNFGMALDASTHLVMFGGSTASETGGMLQDTWTYAAGTWTKAAPATVPFARYKHELAWLAGGINKTYMFGGSNVLNYLNELWSWDGSTWTLVTPASAPSARIDFAMDSNKTDKMVVFGGKNSNSCLNDTWIWNGTTFALVVPATSPSVRAECGFCYDTSLGLFVLFGGRNDNNMLPPETWTFNTSGNVWTKVVTAHSPSARVGAQMCYDSNLGKTILFGGNDLVNPLNDTWSFNGVDWTAL